jgi:hypothetical protein
MSAPAMIDHRGKHILELDFVGIKDPSVLLSRIEKYKAFIASHTPRSLLVISNLTGCVVNKRTVEAFKQFTLHNKPYIRASAVYGLSGFTRIFGNAVNHFSKRDITLFDDVEKAKYWLVTKA